MTGKPTHRRRTERASRRELLRSAGLAATAVTSLSAGCVGSVPLLDDGGDSASVGLPSGGSPSFRQWIPAEGVHGVESFDPPWQFSPARDGSEHLGQPMGFARSMLKPLVDYLGVGVEHYDLAVLLGDSVALEGAVDPDAVGQTLGESGYAAAGQYDDYDVYERFDGPRTCAVREGSVVWARGDSHRERVRAHVDAAAGRVDRRDDVVPAYGRLVDAAGARPILATNGFGGSQFVPNAAAAANGYDVDQDGFYRLSVAVLEPGADPSRSEIRDRFAEAIGEEDVAAEEVTVRDGVVIMAARAPLDALRDDLDSERIFPPQITWGVDREADLLRHEAGEPVAASRLELVDSDHERHAVAGDTDRTVRPGDTLDFGRSLGAEFDLIWTGPDESARLFEYGDG